MSRENVETVRRGFDAWNRADLDEFLNRFRPGRGVAYHGPVCGSGRLSRACGAAAVGRKSARTWTRASISDIRAVGEGTVFVAAVVANRGRRSEALIEAPYWFVVTFRDGLVVRLETYFGREHALEAAGLSE